MKKAGIFLVVICILIASCSFIFSIMPYIADLGEDEPEDTWENVDIDTESTATTGVITWGEMNDSGQCIKIYNGKDDTGEVIFEQNGGQVSVRKEGSYDYIYITCEMSDQVQLTVNGESFQSSNSIGYYLLDITEDCTISVTNIY